MSAYPHNSMLRFSTAGSVDDGKSTLIGRLLHDSGNVYEDHLAALEASARKSGSSRISLALLTDGLKAEREQGITIDVAYRYFSTPKRRFILADSPGHVQYTRNMATAASTVDLTIILVDARAGVLEQTKRHAFIAALLGVPRIVVAINKMDLVGYAESRFQELVGDFTEFSAKLGIREVKFIPISALEGDNVVSRGTSMPWYHGETVLEHLENVYIAADQNLVDLRFPVQYVVNPTQDFRGYAGTVASGVLRTGEEVVVLPSMARSTVKSIVRAGRSMVHEELPEAAAREAVVVQLSDHLDIARGDMIARPKNVPRSATTFEGMLIWLDEAAMDTSTRYLVRHSTREVKGYVVGIEYKIDIHTLGRSAPGPLAMNEIGRVQVSTTTPLFLDPYQKNRATGNFILVDPESFRTVAAGMVIDRGRHIGDLDESSEPQGSTAESARGPHLHREAALVSREERELQVGRRALTIWMTGLSGAGKSTIAKAAERALFDAGAAVLFVDGDNLRHGLNSDLGFNRADRAENLRRAAEVAALLNTAGVTALCAFISPFEADRAHAREIIGAERFLEVFVTAPLEVCEARDPHGLYGKARRGELSGFTGVSAPFETPRCPDCVLDTATLSVEECVHDIVRLYLTRSTIAR